MRMAVQGIGVAGGFGEGLEALRAQDVSLINSSEPRLADVTALQQFVAPRALRRMDHFSKLALLGAHLALQDAGSPVLEPGRTGIIIATGCGPTATTFQFLDGLIDDGPSLVSPMAFAQSVHNIPAAVVGIQLKIAGPCSTISQLKSSVFCGVQTAQMWLAEGRVDRVLFGAIDEYSSVLSQYLVEAEEPSGEGAAFFLFERAQGKTRHGLIGDVRMTNDDSLASFMRIHRVLADRPLKIHGEDASCHANIWGSMFIAHAFELAFALSADSVTSHVCVSRDERGQNLCIFTDSAGGE
nr:beta-ketoacyl synthase chain length factor [Pseudodesulfovibrio sp.]